MQLLSTNKFNLGMAHREGKIFPKTLISIFIILSTLKITLFNMFLVNSFTLQAFLYKFAMTLLFVSITYLIVLGVKHRILFMGIYVIQTIYILGNLIYFIYSRSYLHISQAFSLFVEGVGAVGTISTLIDPKLLIALVDLPVVIYMWIVYPKVTAEIKKTHKIGRMKLVISCLLLIGAMEGWNYMHNYSIISFAKSDSNNSESLLIQRYGTIANSIVDMARNSKDIDLVNRFSYGQNISSGGEKTDKPNFVVIQVESMDANAVNKQHNGKYIMPFLHSLTQQNIYYPYTMSYHEAGGTSDCEFSTINSVEPLKDFPSMKINGYGYSNSIVKQLAKNSYSTIAFHGNVGSYFNRDVAYEKMGYQQLVDMNKMGLKDIGWGAADDQVFSYAEKQLKNEKLPFFAYTITMSSHGPFTNANYYYNNRNYDDVKNNTARNYMNSMSYVDQSIEDYVNYIKSNYKNTYIFIWGDHTPNVNNEDYKQASYLEGDNYFEFVPLIIVTPDNKQYKEDKIVASFLDIAPTILNASGIPYNINSNGLDLISRSNISSSIPYKGSSFDRSYLFEKISQINKLT